MRLRYLMTLLIPLAWIGCGEKGTRAERVLTPLPLNVTHAITVDKPIDDLIFVPNDAASWLGRMMIARSDGSAVSIDIEGVNKTPLPLKAPKSWTGLNIKNAPGLFLAISDNNQISAYIESDDKGGFSQIIVSGDTPKLNKLCLPSSAANSRVYGYSVNDDELAFTADLGNQGESSVPIIQIETEILDKHDGTELYCDRQRPSVTLNGEPYIAFLKEGQVVITPYFHTPPEGPHSPEYVMNLQDGLSIEAPASIDGLWVTQDKFGGAAFNKGLVAIYDGTTKRLVFISMVYLEEKLAALKAANAGSAGSR